jgi:hypothetical protein
MMEFSSTAYSIKKKYISQISTFFLFISTSSFERVLEKFLAILKIPTQPNPAFFTCGSSRVTIGDHSYQE